jgi:HAD superfamily hydrolase (TIGR01450 family)
LAAASDYDCFAIDLDGVMWLGPEPIPGSAAAVAEIRAGGRATVFVTNDPRSTRLELAERLTQLGAETDPESVLSSASATAAALARERPGCRALVVGTGSLAAEVEAAGLESVAMEPDAAADVVVVGGDPTFDFGKLRIATRAVRAGAELWATNRDPTYPTVDGLDPGTGSIVAAIETASGVRSRSIGKPEPGLFEAAAELLGGSRPAMVGDSLDSDVAGALGAGLGAILVLTGRSSREQADDADPAPDIVLDDLAALAAELRRPAT